MISPARTFLLLAAVSVTACGGSATPAAPSTPVSLGSVSDSAWQRLASRRILFGHQSVGANVLEGVAAVLAEQPAIGLKVVKLADTTGVPGGMLVDAIVGENGDPASKVRDFSTNVNAIFAGGEGIALYKYCYLDFGAGTDPDAVFSAYQAGLSELRAQHPGVTFVHVTAPLVTDEGGTKHMIKKVMGKTSGRDLNKKRNRYNQLLREAYAGREPLFDLAELESTDAAGNRSFFASEGEPVYTLATAWTDDGGHLNAAGQRRAAELFLVRLAELP